MLAVPEVGGGRLQGMVFVADGALAIVVFGESAEMAEFALDGQAAVDGVLEAERLGNESAEVSKSFIRRIEFELLLDLGLGFGEGPLIVAGRVDEEDHAVLGYGHDG
jgi:hypothetical protein